MNKLKYYDSRSNNIKVNEISCLIRALDNEFIPPLKDRPEFLSYDDYARRLTENGIILYYRNIHADRVIGFTAFYADPNYFEYAYWSYLGIDKEYRKMGIAADLMKKMTSVCSDLGMKGINGSCSLKNNRMMKLFEANGFIRVIDKKLISEFKKMNPKDNREKAFYIISL